MAKKGKQKQALIRVIEDLLDGSSSSPSPPNVETLTPEQAFGKVLRELRAERGMSQEALAHACDRHRTYISLLERAKHSPSLGVLFNLADALGTNPSEILQRVEARLE